MAEDESKLSRTNVAVQEDSEDHNEKHSDGEKSSSDSESSSISTISKDTISDSSVRSSVTTTTRTSLRKFKMCHKKRTCCGVCLCIFKVAIIIVVFVVLALLSVGFLLARLETKCKLDELSPNLYSGIYGQDVAIRRTLESITNFCTSLTFNEPLMLIFWGPTGVGKTSFATILTDHFDSKGHVIPAEHFKAAKYKDWYGMSDRNKPFVFTVDDVMTLDDMQNIATHVDNFQIRQIVILTTSIDSNLLNQSFIEWCADGKSETDFIYTGQAPAWLAELSHLNPVVVPFLPLSRTNVKLCVENTLKTLKMKYERDDVEKIANEFEYFHNDKRLFSKIGCKRVNDKIFSVLSP